MAKSKELSQLASLLTVDTGQVTLDAKFAATAGTAQTDFVTKSQLEVAVAGKDNTDEITEGSTNLYYTSTRANADFDTRLGTKSTTNLAEGTNLYFTDARAQSALSGTSPSLTNVTLSGYLRGPANFTIDPSAHGDNTGTVIIAGNLQVDGTTTTVNSTTVTVNDLNLVLANNAATAGEANGAGISIGPIGSILSYVAATDTLSFGKWLNPVTQGGTGLIRPIITSFDASANAEPSLHLQSGTSTKYNYYLGIYRGDSSSYAYFDNRTGTGNTYFQVSGSNKVVINSGGAVGVGIDSPAATLHVKRTSGNAGIYADYNSTNVGRIEAASNGNLYIGTITGAGSVSLGNTADANAIFLSPTGLVGIGTVNPSSKLAVQGTGFFSGNLAVGMTPAPFWNIRATDYAGTGGLYIGSVKGGNSMFLAADSYYNNSFLWHSKTTTSTVIDLFNNEIAFKLDSGLTPDTNFTPTTKVIIKADGKVGIGTYSPIRTLHVAQAGRTFTTTVDKDNGDMNGIVVSSNTNLNTMQGIWFSSGGDHSGTHWSGIAGARTNYSTHWGTHLSFYTHNHDVSNITQATEKLRITGDGKVGINVSNPTNTIHALSGSSAFAFSEWNSGASIWLDGIDGDFAGGDYYGIHATNDSKLAMGIGGNYHLTLDSTGKVGVGTYSPAYQLHVVQDVSWSSGFLNHSTFTNPSMTGGGLSIGFGKSGSQYNLAKFVYNHAGDNSSANSLGLGFWDNDNILRVFANGKVTIGTANVGNANATAYNLVLPNGGGVMFGQDYTYGVVGGTNGNLTLTANAYPANTGVVHSITFRSGTAGGGGPAEIAKFTYSADGLLQVGQVINSTSSSIAFNNEDNAVISSKYSQVYQINNTNAVSGRTFSWKTGGKGYGDGSLLMDLSSSGNLSVTGLVSSNGSSVAQRYQKNLGGTYNSGTWYVIFNPNIETYDNGIYVIDVYCDTYAVGGGNYSMEYISVPFKYHNHYTNNADRVTLPTLYGIGHAPNGVAAPTFSLQWHYGGDSTYPGAVTIEMMPPVTWSGISNGTSGATVQIWLRKIG